MRLILKPFVVTGIAALTVCALTSGVVAYAQGRATDVGPESLVTALKAGSPETWGTSSTSVLTIPAFAFNSLDGSIQTPTGPYNRFSPSGQQVLAPVFLPAGALISSIELEGCDSNAAAGVLFGLLRVNSDGNGVALSPDGYTGFATTPGCGLFPLALTPHTVDNANTYYVAVSTGTTNTTSYTAMRVRYKLQVSPAPATATFLDVPTSSGQFKFVEALHAAGITAGCGGGNYCPDTAVTRGQMAVFLAVALGLQFPN